MLAAGPLCVSVGSSLRSPTCQPGSGWFRAEWLKWVPSAGSMLLGLEKRGSLERGRWEGCREVAQACRHLWWYCFLFKVEFRLLT